MKSIDSLDNHRFVDKATGNSLLLTFEDEDHLTIDIDNPKQEPLNTITINVKTGKLEQPSFTK